VIDEMLKSAAEALGVTEVEAHDLILNVMPPEQTAFLHLDFDEVVELHNRIAFALRMAGLKGAALDEAIAAALREAARAVGQQRAIEWKRGKTVRLVQ